MKILPINNYKKNTLTNFQTTKINNSDINSYNYSTEGYFAFKTYAATSPNFKSSNIKSINYELILTDEKKEPRIRLQISNNNKISAQQGIYPVYQMALNDQMYEELSKNPDLHEKGSYIRQEGRKLDIRCPEEELIPTLSMIKDKFIDLNINTKHFEEAKQLAPVGMILDREAKYNSPEYSDISKEMSEEEYTAMINNISINDLENYNKQILDNSDKSLQLYVNRTFYLENKDKINKIINNWF